MSDELRDLYQEILLDHNKRPRNFRELGEATHSAEGYNPLCGDKVTIFVRVAGGVIEDISFQGSGCAISTASASLLTESLKGKRVEEAQELFDLFQTMVTVGPGNAPGEDPRLGKLAVLSGVCEFPVRVKCATLSWHTLKAALNEQPGEVSTE